jgi:hypothetical protein
MEQTLEVSAVINLLFSWKTVPRNGSPIHMVSRPFKAFFHTVFPIASRVFLTSSCLAAAIGPGP